MWTYGLFDDDPEGDGDAEAVARNLAVQGWRTWDAGIGPWITLEGRRLRRWSLRRAGLQPKAVVRSDPCAFRLGRRTPPSISARLVGRTISGSRSSST